MPSLRPIRFLPFLLLWCGAAIAQQPTREAQIPLDPERGVLEIGTALRLQLELFPDQEGFQTARLFRQDDGSLVLEVSRIEQGRLVRERRPWTDAELATFRSDLAGRFAAQGQSGAVDREGRSGLVLTETLLGLGLYGWAVPEGFHIDSSRGAVAAYLLTAGLSFYLPYRITRNASVSLAERNAAVWGATRGIVYGPLVGNLLNGPDDPNESFEASDQRSATSALSVLGMSLAESVLGYQIAQGLGASEGEVAFWSAGGDFGIPFGFGLAYLAGLFDENVQRCEFDLCVVDEYVGTRAGYGATLAMAMASPWLARLSGQGGYYTAGDARALRSMGVLGAQLVLPLAWAAFQQGDRSEDKPLVAAVLAGSAAGIWLGNHVLRERSLTGGDGLLVLAGHLAGGLGALGVTYLLDGGERADDLVYLTTSALGSAAGALLTLQAVSGGSSGRAASSGTGVGIEFTPAAVVMPLLAKRQFGGSAGAPFLTIRF